MLLQGRVHDYSTAPKTDILQQAAREHQSQFATVENTETEVERERRKCLFVTHHHE
jgi:hypothetical protein